MDERLQSSGVNNAGSDMSVTLKWDNYNDLDLIVREPSGDLIFFKEKRSGSQGVLDKDANSSPNTRSSEPVENIKWPVGKAPEGQYEVYVMFYKKSSTEPMNGDTPYEVRMTYAGQDKIFSGSFPNNTREQTQTKIANLSIQQNDGS